METFKKLSAIDVKSKIEQKGRFNYLSWAWAWAEACKVCTPTRKVYKSDKGWNYHSDGLTAWVEVGVTIEGVEHIDMLPVMNNNNKAIPTANINAMDVNKAIQRSTVKALALHGLGIHIYAGEDLPVTPTTPKIEEVKGWIANGKTKDECIKHISSLGCELTEEYKQQLGAV